MIGWFKKKDSEAWRKDPGFTPELGATIMPCGAAVTNVHEAYEAGEMAERARWVAQARVVRNRSDHDNLFKATPLSVMGCESD